VRRAVPLIVFALLVCVPLGSARTAVAITPDSIADIRLGMTQAKANALLAKPVRVDRLELGYQRLVSGKQKLEVYFQQAALGVVTVTTWNRALKTAKGIGPCSSVAALKRAYGVRLRPFRQGGRIVAYRLGNLIFATKGGQIVRVVGLGRTAPTIFVALNAPECR
jgi:hypothetical protein